MHKTGLARIPKPIFSLVLWFYASSFLYGQSTLPTLPPSYKWQQINTPHFQILFPDGFQDQGQRMANTMEHLYKPVSRSLGSDPHKIPIILQNQNSVSNGFVTLGPRRSEFYTTSPQDYNFVGTLDWLDLLAVHEFRHVVQYDKSRTGFTNFIYYLLGEYAQNATASAVVPSWYWEGDAVGMETALTHSGRGRIPDFSMAFRANLLEKGAFNYNKQYLRSYKDFIPNHYVFGFHFATYIKNTYGAGAMQNIVDRTWRLPFIPFEYSFSMQKETGLKMPALYQKMMGDLKKDWQSQIEKEQLTNYKKVTERKTNIYTNYEYPQPLDGGYVLAIKSGLGDIGQIVSINLSTGNEHKEYVLGPFNDTGFISSAGNTVVWTEFRYDPRWLTRSYSVINTYNLVTKQFRQITSKSRYSGASISPDRSKIVTIENTSDYETVLVILDANTGKVLKRIENKSDALFSMPNWDNEGKSIVVLNQFDQKKGVVQIDFETGNQRTLLPYSYEHIGRPVLWKNYLFYNSGLSGIDNIYVLNTGTNEQFRVTSARYGASNPAISADGKIIYYNNYTVNGNDIVQVPLDSSTWESVDNVNVTGIKLYQPLVESEANEDILYSVPDSTYQVSRYHKKPFKIHSWGPLFTGSTTEIEAGIYSTDILSTSDLFVGAEFDNMGNVKGVARVSYQSLYPIIDVTASYSKRVADRSTYYIENDTLFNLYEENISWNETTVKAGLRIPLLLTHSKFHSGVTFHNYVGVTSISNLNSVIQNEDVILTNLLSDGTLLDNEFVFSWYNLLSQSKQDIYSRFGQTFTFENYSTPFGGDFNGGLTALKAQLYFPGIFKHHTINFFLGYQHQKITYTSNEHFFNNRMPYPRGYPARTFEDFYVARSNYDLPLIYPDLSIGPFLYIQRVKATLFYDYGFGKTDVVGYIPTQQSYNSTGIDLKFDLNVFRALPQLELGVRYVYLIDDQQPQFEFLIGSLGF